VGGPPLVYFLVGQYKRQTGAQVPVTVSFLVSYANLTPRPKRTLTTKKPQPNSASSIISDRFWAPFDFEWGGVVVGGCRYPTLRGGVEGGDWGGGGGRVVVACGGSS
jgi:hypothetical protein